MAVYTFLFGVSIFLIAVVVVVIKKMFFHWKQEHKIERLMVYGEEHPTVSLTIYYDKCVIRHRKYPENLHLYDVLSKSDDSLVQQEDSTHLLAFSNKEMSQIDETMIALKMDDVREPPAPPADQSSDQRV